MRPSDKIERLIQETNYAADADKRRQILNDASQALQQSRQEKPAFWRNRMKYTIQKTAIAAIILLAAGILMYNKTGSLDGATIAWADVVHKIQQVNTIIYRTKMIIPNRSFIDESRVWFSRYDGEKTECYRDGILSVIQYALPQKQISVMPDKKEYHIIEASQEQFSKLHELRTQNTPIDLIQRMMECKYKSLGRSVMNGVEVECIESNDPNIGGSDTILMRFWIDVKTLYPVQIEVEDSILDEDRGGNTRKTIHTTSYDFQWNVQIDRSAFVPVIPPDYKLRDTIQLPQFDEKAAIDGLRRFAEMTKRYPASMGSNEFMEEVNAAIKKSFDPNYLEGLSGEKMREIASPFQSLFIFYGILNADKKDPAYYGKTVVPGDANSVLLRWKASDTTYKVIMGDLSIKEMTLEQLTKVKLPL